MTTKVILVENLTHLGNSEETIGNEGKTKCTFLDTMSLTEILKIIASNMNIESISNLRLEYYDSDFEEFANVGSVDDLKDKDATIKLHYNSELTNLARVQEEPVTIPLEPVTIPLEPVTIPLEPVTIPLETLRVQEAQASRNVWDIIDTTNHRFRNVPDTQPPPQPVRTNWGGNWDGNWDGNWSDDVSPQVEAPVSEHQLWGLYKIYIESGKLEDALDVENKLYEHHGIVLNIVKHPVLKRWYCTHSRKSGKLSGLEPTYNDKDLPRDKNLKVNIRISELLIAREQFRFTHDYDKSDQMRTDLRNQFKIEVHDPKNKYVTWWFTSEPSVKYILESKYMHHVR